MKYTAADYVLGFVALVLHALLSCAVSCVLVIAIGAACIGKALDGWRGKERRQW